MFDLTETKGSYTGQVCVRNPEGIHMRPAMCITRLCAALRDYGGVNVLISASGKEGSFVDVAADFDLAKGGFGLAYASLTSMVLGNGSRPTVRVVSNDMPSFRLQAVFLLMKDLFADHEVLQLAGTSERFNTYLRRAGVPEKDLSSHRT